MKLLFMVIVIQFLVSCNKQDSESNNPIEKSIHTEIIASNEAEQPPHNSFNKQSSTDTVNSITQEYKTIDEALISLKSNSQKTKECFTNTIDKFSPELCPDIENKYISLINLAQKGSSYSIYRLFP